MNQVPHQLDDETFSTIIKQLLSCDIVFPAIHGPYGEDGKLQGFLETLGMAHMNCSTKASAICMDKAILKKIAHYHQLPTLPFIDFSDYDWHSRKDSILHEILQTLAFPVFVKPVHLGSTIGVAKAFNENDLETCIANALQYDNHIIVEKGIEGREIEFAIYGNNCVQVFAPGEILVSGIYDFDSKYGESAAVANPAADLPQAIIEIGMKLAKQAYKMACCDGFARVDFFLDKNGQFYLNEINPIPGFTKHSMYPKICEKNGVSYYKLINHLAAIGLNKKRHLHI